jgi:hypothetical protein
MAIRKAKTAAAELNEDFPADPVHWREIISLPTPDGVQLNLLDEPNTPEPEELSSPEGGRLTNLDRSGSNGSTSA